MLLVADRLDKGVHRRTLGQVEGDSGFFGSVAACYQVGDIAVDGVAAAT